MKFDLHDLKTSVRYMDPTYYKNFFTGAENGDFYQKFFVDQFILRDHLAIDRTMLANESTFLSYIRTALAMSAAGGTLLHFGLEFHTDLIGGVLVAGGMILFVVGVFRYRHTRSIINQIRKKKHGDITKMGDEIRVGTIQKKEN